MGASMSWTTLQVGASVAPDGTIKSRLPLVFNGTISTSKEIRLAFSIVPA